MVRKLVTGKGLPCKLDGSPAFTSYEQADAWRAENAPPRKTHKASLKNSAEDGEKNARSSDTTRDSKAKQPGAEHAGHGDDDEAADDAPAAELRERAARGFVYIDVEKFIRKDCDFDSLMIEQAERVPQIAFGLLELKQKTGAAGAIAAATENWSQAVKQAASVRAQFLDLQERTRALIQLDQVMDIVGTELQALRTALLKLGERTAARANPENPAVAQAAIDAAVDDVFRQTQVLLARTKKELGVV